MTDPRFTFEPYTGDACIGKFHVDDAFLRRVLSSLKDIDVYGLRYFESDGTASDVAIMDPRRAALEAAARKFGEGAAGLEVFKELVPPGCGMVINSPQNPNSGPENVFNELARLFLDNLQLAPGRYPEQLYMTVFFGAYERGFELHRDADDTTLFVIDGRKHFVIGLDEQVSEYTATKGEYLRWRSVHLHGNRNPNRDWSMTIHFAIGPAGARQVTPGTPVEFAYAETQLNDYVAQAMKRLF